MRTRTFIEVSVIFLLIFGGNYYFDRGDLLYFNTPINIYFYALVIVSLFYGLYPAALFYALYFIFEFVIYQKVNFYTLSHYFIFLFIFSEFMYYWTKKIEKLEEENRYLKRRVEEVGSAYYLLKISHDELEKNYILKPFSIREVLREIKNLTHKAVEESYELFMTLLKNLFKLESARFYLKKDEEFVLKNAIGENKDINLEDPLVKDALETYTISYVGNLHEKKSDYLAVIPIISLTRELRGLFVIEDMPFFSLTKDNLITISLFLTYFTNMVSVIEEYKDSEIDPFIAKEIKNLRFLSLNYKVENHLVIFYIREKVEKVYIQKFLRGSDIYFEYLDKLVVILPLTSAIGVTKFIDRLSKEKKLAYKIVDLSQYDLDDIKRLLNEY
jgi:hypothetical protein